MKNRNLEHIDDWATPDYFMQNIYDEFGTSIFDPCPLKHDIKQWDGLKIEWGKLNFVNPPYSRKLKDAFVKKAIEESKKGKLCIMLLPVSTSTKLFHYYIKRNATEIRFIYGRIKFVGINTFGEKVTNKVGMHDSMLVIFGKAIK